MIAELAGPLASPAFHPGKTKQAAGMRSVIGRSAGRRIRRGHSAYEVMLSEEAGLEEGQYLALIVPIISVEKARRPAFGPAGGNGRRQIGGKGAARHGAIDPAFHPLPAGYVHA